ncbi:MAG: hypothetical protein GY751_23710 [Bacteroidetes bacterium]|nr:hypothetical protein [Bacteroidota bacterium]
MKGETKKKSASYLRSKPVLWHIAFLVLLTLIAYANTFNHGFNLDDFLIQANLPSAEEGWKGVFSVFGKSFNRFDYRPVSMLSFALEQQIQGSLVPRTSHIVNVLLYTICSLFLFAFVKRLPIKNASVLAFATAAIFIVHPIHTNVVSSMKNRDSILSLSVVLISLILVMKFIRYKHDNWGKQAATKTLYFLLAIAFFFLATITKLDSLTLIVIIPLVLFIFWRYWWTLLFGGGLGFLLFRAFEFIRYKIITERFLEKTAPGESTLITENPMIANDAFIGKISTGLASLFYYLKFHLLPKGYYYYFGFDMIRIDYLWTWQNMVTALALLISAIAFFYYLRKRPEISLAIAIFFGGLTYCLNIVTPIAGIVAPRLAFIASVGFCLLLASMITHAGPLIRKLPGASNWNSTKISYGLLGLVVLFYLPFTIQRNAAWKDIYTLIEYDAPHLGKSFEGQRIACMNYLSRAKKETNQKKASQYWNKCLTYCEGASSVYDMDQFVEEAIGIAYTQLGNQKPAFKQFKKVLANFDTTEIANEMIGDLFMLKEKPDSALAYYEKLININPGAHIGYIKYTRAVDASGRYEEGIETCVDFAARFPEYPYVLESIGYMELQNTDTMKAAEFLLAAIFYGAPPDAYMKKLVPYLERNGREDLLLNFQNGEVKSREELLRLYD